jgi:stage II sporulation protein D
VRILLALALLLAQLPMPADAAPLAALPATVRVNVAGLGTSYAVIGSTGTLTVTQPDGTLVYRGIARTVARRNVRRIEGAPAVPQPATDPEERLGRSRLLREARDAIHSGNATLTTIPFEYAILRGATDDMGSPAISSDRIVPLRFKTDDGFLTFNGRAFKGTLELALDDENDMILVNEVATADYLASVVGAEIPPTWEPEALAAQAIAARTYLVTHLRRHRAYDLEGDVRDQEYGGAGTEADSTVRAVRRTAGIVATYRGSPIEALYSANAGGVTEDSENVYANALPYLRSVPSPWDDAAKSSSWGHTSWEWTRELTVAQLRDHLAVRGLDVGTPQRVALVDVSPTGRVLKARVEGSQGSRDIAKDQSRHYFGLRSSLFTVERVPGGALEAVELTEIDRTRALEGLGAERLGAVYRRIVGPDRETNELRIVGSVYRLPDRFVFKGRGFGHGVGMSQWGAQGMALGGAKAEQILTHYYRGIELTNVGGA